MSLESAIDRSTILKRGAITWVMALVINLVALTVVLQADLVADHQFLHYGPVAFWTTVGIIGASAVYWWLATQRRDPNPLFVRIAIVVLVLSFAADVGLYLSDEDATAAVAATLASLHIPPALASIAGLTGWITDRFS